MTAVCSPRPPRTTAAGEAAVRDTDHVFAACAPGLEPLLAAELRALGLAARDVPGGAEATGEDAAAVACVGARLADAVAVRLYEGPAAGARAALAEARRRLGPGVELAVRRQGGRATVSADAAGAPLFRRGWRARVGAAPLRETLAAGLLAAAGYDGAEPLLDPMCGAGTLVLEAAALAARRPPGHDRRFAFEGWPGHDAGRTAAVRARLAAGERRPPAPLLGSDRNGGVLRLAQKNAAAGGFEGWVTLTRCDAGERPAPGDAGLIAVNPPYGLRLDAEVEAAWRALGRLLERLPRWRAVVLAPQAPLERLLPRPPARALRVRNGGLPCRILVLDAAPSPAAPGGGPLPN